MKKIKLKTEQEVQEAIYYQYEAIHNAELTALFSEYFKNLRNTNGFYRLLISCQVRISELLKKDKNKIPYIKLLGCSKDKLKYHLESKFKPGMSWDNYGAGFNGKGMQEWHVDHIIPCVSFDLSKPEEQHKCFNYTNLQPLWAKENRSKISQDKLYKVSSL